MRIQNGRATVDSQTRLRHDTWDAKSLKGTVRMTSPEAHRGKAPAIDFSATKAALWLSLTAFFALLVLYFVGMDQGATSVFGANTVIHEFVHDARHLLGFPCH